MRVKRKNKIKILLLVFALVLSLAGCGTSDTQKSEGKESLKQVNAIPEDGIITKEQLSSIAGKEKNVQFQGKTEDGISYTWTYDGTQIQNPVDQNLKIEYQMDGLEDIKKEANGATNAIEMTMHNKEMICRPTLEVTLPETWDATSCVLVKEQNGTLAKLADVSVQKEEEKTTFTMEVASMDGTCYIVGGGGKSSTSNASTEQTSGDSKNSTSNTAQKAGSDGQTSIQNGTSQNKTGQNDASTAKSKSGGTKSTNTSSNSEKNTKLQCTISIDCKTILKNKDKLDSAKKDFVPSNGVILKTTKVTFEKGDSVHDILKKVCRSHNIHMESEYTPAYKSAYVEGIHQLYEFDCGEQSGWMYSVNGWYPNYGSSNYKVKDGDVIRWVYTCENGKDVQ